MSDFSFRQSELHEWLICRRSTDWNYWQKLSPKSEKVGAASLGTLTHGGLEDGYNLRAGFENAGTFNKLAATADPAQLKLATTMLNGYWQWVEETGADAGWEIVGVEKTLAVVWPSLIHGMTVEVTGKADLLIVDAFGMRRLIDHKTVDQLNPPQPPSDFQRQTYAVIEQIATGQTYAGAIHNKLRKVGRTAAAKPPFYGRSEIHFNLAQLRSHYRHMESILNEMVYTKLVLDDAKRAKGPAGEDHLDDLEHRLLPPNPHRDCSWRCDFYHLCPMRDDGSAWQDFIGDNFTRGGIITDEEEEEEEEEEA